MMPRLTKRLYDLMGVARSAFAAARFEEAATLYESGIGMCQADGVPQMVPHFRFWQGVSLSYTGDYRGALRILTPTLRKLDAPARPSDIHNTLAFYVNIGMDVPLPLHELRQGLNYCHEYMARIGKTEWRHQIVLLEARLAAAQGDFRRALALAQESWSVWKPRYPYRTADAHLRQIVRFALAADQPETAAAYLSIWRHIGYNEMPRLRAYNLVYWETALLRYQGDLTKARHWAARAITQGAQVGRRDQAAGQLVRVQFALGHVAAARHTLCQMAWPYLRRRPLLLLDYHLAQARVAAGMPPVDDQYGDDIPAVPPCHTARGAIQRARALYPVVVGHARRWDAAFECNWRQREVAARLARL